MYEAPTTASNTHRLVEVHGLAMRWGSFVVDFSRAFFQGDPYESGSWEDQHVWMIDPLDTRVGVKRDQRRVIKLMKDVPGLRRAPQSWQKKLRKCLLDTGHVPSRTDAAMYLHMDKNGCVDGIVPTHVDDVKGRGTDHYLSGVLPKLTTLLETGKCETYTYLQGCSPKRSDH